MRRLKGEEAKAEITVDWILWNVEPLLTLPTFTRLFRFTVLPKGTRTDGWMDRLSRIWTSNQWFLENQLHLLNCSCPELEKIEEMMVKWCGTEMIPQTPFTKTGTEESLYWSQIVKLMSCSTKYNTKSDTRKSQSTDLFIESHIAGSLVIQLIGWVVYVIH